MDVKLMAKAPAALIDVGVPCKKGHVCGRYAVSKKCVTCATEAALAWNEANKAKHRANMRAYAARNPEKRRAVVAAWRKANPDKVKVLHDSWRAANLEKYLNISRTWKRRNPAHRRAKAAERRAMKLQRTPAWLTADDFAAIKAIYAEAAEKIAATGLCWHVDHIVPLLGKNVSGLHVPWNLQIIPGSENMRKGNRHDG
jgi:hypothetical protein